jgi:t-SNARE complex subunit (syntaxin)
MKLWHQKFSERQAEVKQPLQSFEVSQKSKMTYRFHQFLIWIVIFSVIILIVNFFKTNTNFN